MGVLLRMETAHPQKLAGIGLAVLGAICMVGRRQRGGGRAGGRSPSAGR